MPAIVRANPIEVANRLEQLGWSVGDLLEVVGAMVSARNSCTENDPSSAPGWMAWKEGTRRLREIGRPRGLLKDDTDQIPSLVDAERGLKFLVSNTDDGTGCLDRLPQNRNKKGPATERVVEDNQGSLFSEEELAKVISININRRPATPDSMTAWYLCVFAEGDDHRAEISCPVDVEAGFFTDFNERIILVGRDGGGAAPVRRRDDDFGDGSEFDIPVSRK